jgi:hypothetical protein
MATPFGRGASSQAAVLAKPAEWIAGSVALTYNRAEPVDELVRLRHDMDHRPPLAPQGDPMLDSNKVGSLGVLALGLALFACSSSSSSSGSILDGGGGGGARPTGTGGGTTGGSGGSGLPECQPPQCFTDFANMVQSCGPMGTCVQQMNGTAIDFCYSNGSKAHVTTTLTMATALITGPDGSACFSFDFALDPNSQVLSINYRNASGQLVATVTGNADGSATVGCPGQASKTLPASCNMEMPGMDTMCTMGACM